MRAARVLSACLVVLSVGAALSAEVVDLSHDEVSSLQMLSEKEGHMQEGEHQVHELGQANGLPVGQQAQIQSNGTRLNSNDDDGKASTKAFKNANPFVSAGQDAEGAANGGDASGSKSVSQVNRTTDSLSEEEKTQEKNERDRQQTRANKLAGSVDLSKKAPLSLAGKYGHDSVCLVKEDSVVVSGNGESGCLFKQPMIKGSGFAVEIAFDVSFGSLPIEGGARHGGIFYGAKAADSMRDGSPVIEWFDKPPARGYRVYGNKDIQKLDGLRPGPNPNKRWKITIQPDGKAKFEAGPRTWLDHFTPDMKGPYIGFFVSGSTLSISNIDIRKAPVVASDTPAAAKKAGLVMTAEQGYGVGTAKLFYSASGGEMGAIRPNSVYLHGSTFEPRDFRTVTKQPGNIGGDVSASGVLSAGRFLEVEAAAGYGLDHDGFAGSTRLFHIANGKGHLKSNSVYLAEGNFRTEEGSIEAKKNVVAGRTLKLGAMQGAGDAADNPDAEFWYAEIGNDEHKIEPKTLHLRTGSLATTRGDMSASDSVTAKEYFRIKSDNQGQDEAKFFFSQKALDGFESDTVFLQNGNLATATGNVFAGRDLVTDKVKLNAKPMYGAGAGELFFVEKAAGKFTSNSLYVSSSLAALAGSIESKKDLVSDRIVKIGTGNAKTTAGGAHLWYCASATEDNSGLEDESLYLKAGDFRTQSGSIFAKQALVATRYLTVSSSGDNFGAVETAKAKLWYAKKSSGETEGNTLYLRSGDFGAQTGSIVSPESLVAGKNVEIHALKGFGTTMKDSVQLYYSAKPLSDGNTESALYLRKGDFRLEAGSIHTTDVSAKGSIQVSAKQGFGEGTASLFYVAAPMGSSTYQPSTLYLKGGTEFSVSSLIAAKDLIATRSAKVTATSGHGSGEAELWFGQQMSAAGQVTGTLPDHVYVRTGNFATQKGDLAAKFDVETIGGEITIGDRHGAAVHAAKAGKAQLWYASSGTVSGGIAGTSLYLRKGDLATMAGNVVASKDIVAGRSLIGVESHTTANFKCNQCSFGRIFMMPHDRTQTASAHAPMSPSGQDDSSVSRASVGHPTLLEESMEVLLDESTGVKTKAIDVGAALTKLRASHKALREEETALTGLLRHAQQRLATLEGAFAA